MFQRIVTRRAAEVRALLEDSAFDGIRVPLPNGGTLPAVVYADIALRDLDFLTGLGQGEEGRALLDWQRLAAAIELLHEVASAPKAHAV